MIAGILIALLVVVALGVGLRLYMSRAAEDRLLPGEDVAIADLRGPLPQNGFLACPEGYCAVEPGLVSPVFAMTVERLSALWPKVLQGQRGVVTVLAAPDRRHVALIQHSAMFGFPDVITVEFVAVEPERSSLAIYSRARYGKLDFGVNRRRVESGLARLQQLAAAQPAR